MESSSLFIKEKDLLIDEMKELLKPDIIVRDFMKVISKILDEYDCSFGYVNRGSRKNGHVRLRIDKVMNQRSLELKINRNDNVAGKVYTLIHEVTHLYNEHLESKNLTRKQAEIVADSVAMIFIYALKLEVKILDSDVASKWDVFEYSNNYIKSMACSDKRKIEIFRQIRNTVLYFKGEFKC